MKNDKNSANKTVKLKEKEITRLQSKIDNLEDQVKNKKAENELLVEEKNKLLKEKKILASEPQKISLKSIATNTAPVSNIEAYVRTENKEDPIKSLHSISTAKPVQALP